MKIKVYNSYSKTDGHVKVEVTADNVVTVTEDDIASAQLLGTATDASTANTAFGKIAAEADRATKAEGGLNTRVTNIETLIGDAENPDTDSVINKVTEVIDWFKDVSETEKVPHLFLMLRQIKLQLVQNCRK